MNAAPVHAVLLAAGEGRRLGQPKALLELRGNWMLPRLVAALRAGGAARVHLVLRAEEEAEVAARGGSGADEVHRNPRPTAGRTGSLLCALAAVPAGAAVLMHPCDVPLLSAEVVRALIAAWRAQDAAGDWVARPTTPGGRGGHPLLIGPARVPEVLGYGPDEPLRRLLHDLPERRLDLPVRGDPGPFLDVDTPEQYALVESLLAP